MEGGCDICENGFAYDGTLVANQGSSLVRRYRCSGKSRMVEPINLCSDRSWQADKLEAIVWQEIVQVLDNPGIIVTEIKRQREDSNKLGVLETELIQVERLLKTLDRN